jgi:hypothetical protein
MAAFLEGREHFLKKALKLTDLQHAPIEKSINFFGTCSRSGGGRGKDFGCGTAAILAVFYAYRDK